MPVQVADVGQEWPAYSKIDSPVVNGRGSQDGTSEVSNSHTTSEGEGSLGFVFRRSGWVIDGSQDGFELDLFAFANHFQ